MDLLERLENQQISVNRLLNSTGFLDYALCMWRRDISYEEFLDDKEVKDSIANDILDDEELEILAEAQDRVRYGPETQEFEDAINSLYSAQ